MGKQKKIATKKQVRTRKRPKDSPAAEAAAPDAALTVTEVTPPDTNSAALTGDSRSERRQGRPRGRKSTRPAAELPPASLDGSQASPAENQPAAQKSGASHRPIAPPASSPVQVETVNDTVVIRFPPVAPRSQRPAEAKIESPAPPTPVRREPLMEKAPAILETPAAAPPAPPPPKFDRAPTPPAAFQMPTEAEFQRLSPSQKRRLRRKRRAQQLRTDEPESLENEAPTSAVASMETAPPPAALPPENMAEVEEEPELPTFAPAMPAFESPERFTPAETPPVEEPAETPEAQPFDEESRETDPRRRRRRRGRGRGRNRDRGRDRDQASDHDRDRDREPLPEPTAVVLDSESDDIRNEIEPPEDAESGDTLIDLLAQAEEESETETSRTGPASRKEMIINVSPREECRICILKDGKLEEIYLERASAESHVGNIYKGVITNVEPSIQAAFIDFGLPKNGFLHISDLHPQYFPGGGQTENVGRKIPRSHRPPIQRCLRRGQEVIVQVTREGIGTKGPTLTTYLSIPGRFLVMMPGMRRLGVSRKIEDDEARDKIRDSLSEMELPEGVGFIARTAAMERTKRELQSDLQYLTRLWRTVEERRRSEKAPAELYRESDLVIRTIRDVYTSDIERIVVDDRDVADRARNFLAIFSPKARDAVVVYDSPTPIFHKYGIEDELERLHSRHVPFKSGGSLVIDQTEALVAIDVNSGRFRTEDDAENTAYKINLEAADEIPRQLRLRDLGGVIVCDFIDMRMESHRREIERRLTKNLKEHKERVKVLRMSEFGIIEMTRQRQRASLTRSVYQDCHHCRGTGLVKTSESVVLDIVRLLQLAMTKDQIQTIEVSTSAEVAHLLLNRKRALLQEMETKNRRSISIRGEQNYGLDQIQINCYDARGRLVPHT